MIASLGLIAKNTDALTPYPSMSYELDGTIKVIFPTATFGKGFTKREFVVTLPHERFPQDIKLEFVKDKVSLLDNFQPGQKVKVAFDLRGGEYNGKYFVNLSAWKIAPSEGGDSTEMPSGGGYSAGGRTSHQGQGGGYQRRDGGGGSSRQQGQGGGGYQQRRTQPPPPPDRDYPPELDEPQDGIPF